MTLMALSTAHDSDARNGTHPGTKVYKTSKQLSQHDKCNGILDGTISIM